MTLNPTGWRTRRSQWLVFPILFFGLALGYLTRVLLQRWIETSRARVDALELLRRLREERERRPGAIVRRRLQEAIETPVQVDESLTDLAALAEVSNATGRLS
jgi:hypothetical protein